MRTAIALLVCLLMVVGCTSTEQAAGSAGCESALAAPGEYEGLNVVGESEQPYWVVVPESYTEAAPAPLYLHLASGTGDHDFFLEGWRPQLDDLDGLMAMVNTAGGWQNDVYEALIDQIGNDYCIDPLRVHVMGTSSSFYEAERLACEAPDRIASFVAALGGGAYSPCAPDRPVPLLTFTGDPDRWGAEALLDTWVELNGCDPEPVVEDLGSGVYRKTYQNCEADILFYDIEGMGHYWPMHEAKGPGAGFIAEYDEVDYLEEALQFFAEHPMP